MQVMRRGFKHKRSRSRLKAQSATTPRLSLDMSIPFDSTLHLKALLNYILQKNQTNSTPHKPKDLNFTLKVSKTPRLFLHL